MRYHYFGGFTGVLHDDAADAGPGHHERQELGDGGGDERRHLPANLAGRPSGDISTSGSR